MQVEIFLEQLYDAMPNRDDLEDYGLEEGEIQEIQGTFVATKRRFSTGQGSGEIERLIEEFDCSKVEIGLIRFQGKLSNQPYGTVFAFCEADPLAICADGSIAMFDHESPDSKQVKCASNSERFLDALAAFIDIRANKSHWKGRIGEAAEVCANAAGGSQFQEFFRLLCGFIG